MTPEARLAAAAEILDRYLAGEPAEKVLTNWARRSRFAGSKDRAAVRDHVFDAIRRRRSVAGLGGAETGRGMVIGLLRDTGQAPEAFLTGQGHAMSPLSAAEAARPDAPGGNAGLDCPDWLAERLHESLGEEFEPVMTLMRSRADLFLRVNIRKADRKAAQDLLATEGVTSEAHPLCDTALRVCEGGRSLRNSRAYRDGLVEIQDVASQAVAAAVPVSNAKRVLDYCAGGGGKALALAARSNARVFVHDANPARMADIPDRARRAGVRLSPVPGDEVDARAPYDLVLADVPCSGSGAWRRQPEAKWRLTAGDLAHLRRLQGEILARVSGLVNDGGAIAYMTCSVLREENEQRITDFLAERPGWIAEESLRISPLQGGDGFFLAILRKTT